MDIKRYVIGWFCTLDLIVEIDHDIVTEKELHEINNFWSDSQDRLMDADGNVLHAVLKMLGQRCWPLLIANWTMSGSSLSKAFDEEGWPPMDGSCGFRIIDCDELEFDESDITVSEIIE
ncbi:DUF2528 family protein [Serratia fonticola]|uniref:DUF2528 family protein n=1 Tax=Serratia fonticola TaxID=47917 RepID=UPI0013782551|nr:DUF2528 family protein [Serratia fonticola]NCG55251.1 DUF2528 family protein [Serratia fonticola]